MKIDSAFQTICCSNCGTVLQKSLETNSYIICNKCKTALRLYSRRGVVLVVNANMDEQEKVDKIINNLEN